MGTTSNEPVHRYPMTLKEDMPSTPSARQRPLPPPNRRRDKAQLSCNLCRRRKVKCDRQQPCKTCSLRGLAISCTYPSDATSSRPSDRDSSTVQNRIRELEGLVHVLMQRAASKPSSNITSASHASQAPTETLSHSAEASPDPAVPGTSGPGERSSSGMLTLTNNSSNAVNYVDGAHWSALLDSISELKDCFPETTDPGSQFRASPPVVPDYGPSPQLLYGRFAQATKAEILSAIPARPIVDRMVSKFFNTMDLAPSIIHRGQFIRQYGQFWEDPFAAPIMWVGLLFSMMCVATLFSMPHAAQDWVSVTLDTESAIIVRVYREKIIQCLTLGKYTRGGPFVIETLVCYIGIEHLLIEDPEFGTHILLGIIFHIAMRMGYHRDPKNFPVISVFDGEMRRRAWAAIYQANLIFASQMGLPSMLKEHQIDTEEPRNLADADLTEDLTELPPSRPEHELTPVTYIIIRSRIANLWEKVRDIATDTRLHKYEEILAMDRVLEAHKNKIPPGLRMQPIAESIADPPHLIMQRVWLEICFLRLQIVLHKNYFIAPNHLDKYRYSRSVSLNSAMKIIGHQHMIYELVVPDGLLYDARWKLSSVLNNEFLLATTTLCAYIKQLSFNPRSVVEGVSVQEISQLLEKSLGCWERFSATSSHARRAMEVIRLVLKAANTPTASPTTAEDGFSPMFAFQDPLLLNLNFPCSLESFYNGDSSTSASEPSLDSASFSKQQPLDEEWINMFERVSTRQPD
ncbi:fungal-specific transcription factor domain-containing protein [Hypoxylon cercidicola]|nr:fungal-specific transcription factor domain-containing protein [Hypoxylon cercidicola]